MTTSPERLTDLLRLRPGVHSLEAFDPKATPGFTGDKARGREVIRELAPRLSDLQERLFAHGRTGGRRRVLLVLQGMDTSGKGGTVRHVLGLVDPQGVQVTAFGVPTPEERQHDFLWRIERKLPLPGRIGVFDRSHYEDVVIVRVHALVDRSTIEARYEQINAFERRLVDAGTTVIKVFLHISREESKQRLLARLDNPKKHWKFDPGDIDERLQWSDYVQAYETAFERCATEHAPWHVVPADHKWYRNWAITNLLIEALEDMELQWPTASFDVEAERARLLVTP